MSGAGGIELVLGVFVLAGYLVRGAVYIAGGAIYLAAKGAFAAGRAIYNAHKNREEKRLKQAKEELSRVQGEIRDMALARHEELAKADIIVPRIQDIPEAVVEAFVEKSS